MSDYVRTKPGWKRYGRPRVNIAPVKMPAQQTAKANTTPRLGQRKMKSPFKRLQAQRSDYGIVSKSYNVGRTRRMA